jgi:hypothetical protein
MMIISEEEIKKINETIEAKNETIKQQKELIKSYEGEYSVLKGIQALTGFLIVLLIWSFIVREKTPPITDITFYYAFIVILIISSTFILGGDTPEKIKNRQQKERLQVGAEINEMNKRKGITK